MYVADLQSRKEGLEFLDATGKGKHLELTKCLLEKVVALIIEPLSPGTLPSHWHCTALLNSAKGRACQVQPIKLTSALGQATSPCHHTYYLIFSNIVWYTAD